MRSMIYWAFFFRSIFFGFTSQNSVGLNFIFIDLYLVLYHKYPHDKINYGVNPTSPPPKSTPISPTNNSATRIKIFIARGGNKKCLFVTQFNSIKTNKSDIRRPLPF